MSHGIDSEYDAGVRHCKIGSSGGRGGEGDEDARKEIQQMSEQARQRQYNNSIARTIWVLSLEII